MWFHNIVKSLCIKLCLRVDINRSLPISTVSLDGPVAPDWITGCNTSSNREFAGNVNTGWNTNSNREFVGNKVGPLSDNSSFHKIFFFLIKVFEFKFFKMFWRIFYHLEECWWYWYQQCGCRRASSFPGKPHFQFLSSSADWCPVLQM